ncbi:MAG: Ig-like domain repeat protein [Bifidobacteriaceae bacterium]|jgi:hypothetical protein|nr:Ig-like domain repeat protein [Bifidobacteriaceae bacterium]
MHLTSSFIRRASQAFIASATLAGLTLTGATPVLAEAAVAAAPTETVTGQLLYADGQPGALLRYYFDDVDCVTGRDTAAQNHHSSWESPARPAADGTFSFPSYAGACYRVAVLDESGYVAYPVGVNGAPAAGDFARLTSGQQNVRLTASARLVQITMAGAKAGDTAAVYGQTVNYYFYEGTWLDGYAAGQPGDWWLTWDAPVLAGGNALFTAQVGKKYTVYFNGNADYYPQTLGGEASTPPSLLARNIQSVTVASAPGTLTGSFKLKKYGAGAKFTPKLKATEFKVGKKISVTGQPAGWKLKYQWLSDGVPVSGARKKTYTPSIDDAGAKVSVQVTASNPGYRTVAKKSKAKTIGKVDPGLSVKLAKASVKPQSKAAVTATVKVKGLRSPEGTVKVTAAKQVKNGKKRTVKASLKRYDYGKLTLKLPKLGKGAYKVTVTYSGSSQVAKRVSQPVTLTVK